MFQSQRDVLNIVLKYNTSVGNNGKDPAVNASMKKVNYTKENTKNVTRKALRVLNHCLYTNAKEGMPKRKRTAAEDPCEKVKKAVDDVLRSVYRQAQENSDFWTLTFLLNSDDRYKSYLQSKIQSIDREIEKINTVLNGSDYQSIYLGDIADLNALNQLDTEPYSGRFNKWLQFEYSHNSSQRVSNKEKVGVSQKFKGSVTIKKVTVGLSSNNSVDVSVVNDALKRSSLKISGELLRVTIKRPWLRPSLFENPTLFFVSSTTLNL